LDEIFSDEEGDAPHEYDEVSRHPLRPDHRNQDEFADFIEEDDLEDEDEQIKRREEMEVARPRDRAYTGSGGLYGQPSGIP